MKSACIILFMFFSLNIFAQHNSDLIPTTFTPLKPVTYIDFFDKFSSELNIEKDNVMIPQNLNIQQRNSSGRHVKYKQYYKGFEVYGVSYTLHGDAEYVKFGTGTYLPNLKIDTDIIVPEDKAQGTAMHFIKTKSAKPFTKLNMRNDWNVEIIDKVIIDRKFPKITGDYTLAYRLHVTGEALKYEILISADDNTVIFDQSLIKHGHADGIGKTFYYGNQKIVTDSVGPNNFVLRDLTRGDGITTYTMQSGTPKLLTDNDNIWDDEAANDLVAIDAHWITARFYDMMNDSLDYAGLDGNGKSMNPVIFYGGMENFVNAFWDGDKAYFGQGDCHNGPLTTLTVVAHEFTHGVTQYNSNLIYNGESGALNESLSDVFGKALDIYINKNNFSWDLGPDFSLSPFSELFRSFSDPNKVEHPKMYKGLYWEDGADVHINSSVMNHWFYLLVEGGNGVNESVEYDIKKINMTELLKIVFLCQTSFLTPTSGYQDMYEFSLLACEQLYGAQSQNYVSIKEAWKAVGLPFSQNTKPKYDLKFEMINPEEFICTDNFSHPLNFIITNAGTEKIEKSTELYIETFDKSPLQIFLDGDLLPDNSQEFLIDDYLEYGDFNWIWEDVVLQYEEDENLFNNEATVYYEKFESEQPDLFLGDLTIFQKSCFSDDYVLNIAVYNASCNVFPPNQNLKVEVLSNDVIIKTLDLVIENPIFPGFSYQINDVINIKEDIDYVDVKINTVLDINEDNDFSSTQVGTLTGINMPFNYTFSNNSFENDFETSYYIDYTLYQNESYLLTSGSGFNLPPCPKLNDNFDNNPFNESSSFAQTCLDLSAYNEMELSFDMIQFRSGIYDQLNNPTLSAQTSVLKIELNGEDGKLQNYFYDLPIGEKFKQKIALPKGYKGLLKFGFYNNFGLGYFDEDETENIDAILMDNLKLDNLTSSSDLILDEIRLRIVPNPVVHNISLLDIFDNNATYKITNASGQVMTQAGLNSNLLDVSTLPSGYYVLQVNSDKLVKIASFIKL